VIIIDAHQHLGNMPINPQATEPLDLKRNLAKRIGFMDRFGIDQAIMLPSNAQAAPRGAEDRARANDMIAEYIARAPGRLIAGLGTVHPADGDLALEEVVRCVRDLGLRGIVWHHRFLGVRIDHPGMHAILDLLAELRVPAFVHVIAESQLESPWRLEGVAEAHPDVQFVALDGFSSADHAGWMFQIARRRANIHFDTGVATSVGHKFREFIEELGPDRLLLGTDLYCEPELFAAPFPLLEIRDHLDLSEHVKAQVLGGNISRLLAL